jgi:hypothetical protein
MLVGTKRDEIAAILERIAKEGLNHPRNLDAALDAIEQTFEPEPLMKCITGEEVWFVPGDDRDDAIMAFGDSVRIEHGYFVAQSSE